MGEEINVMVDIETMGTTPGSVILSIGAMTFDFGQGTLTKDPFLDAEGVKTFHEFIDMQASLEFGLTVDFDTVRWWMEQSKEAQKIFYQTTKYPGIVIYDFYSWLYSLGSPEDLVIWSHSTFDVPLIEAMAKKVGGGRAPWNHRNTRDIRTLQADALAMGVGKYEYSSSISAHDALKDCVEQIKMVRWYKDGMRLQWSVLKGLRKSFSSD